MKKNTFFLILMSFYSCDCIRPASGVVIDAIIKQPIEGVLVQNSNRRNITTMVHKQHVALHQLFRNLTTPKEQLLMIKELYNTVLSDHAKELFETLTNINDKDFYAHGIVK